MKKRLRKKLRVKVFTEYGFELYINFIRQLSDAKEDILLNHFTQT